MGVKVNAVKHLIGKFWRYGIDCPCCEYNNVMHIKVKDIEEDGSKKELDTGVSLEEASGLGELKKKRRTRWDIEMSKPIQATSVSEYKKIKNKEYWDNCYPDVPESERFDVFDRYDIAVFPRLV